ncbi:unnamed protein product [Closterium sp. NIES-53]
MANIMVVAAAKGGQQQPLPLPDMLSPQQLRDWVIQRARPGGGGFGFLRTAQQWQQSQQETFSPQVLSELVSHRCVLGSVEAAALGASESAAAQVLVSQVAASSRVSASGQLAASCSCQVLSHQTLLWHHCLGHPSLPRLHSMHSLLLVSGLPRSLPSLPRSPTPPCLPCIEGRQRAAPHSSEFPPTTAPPQTLHMDVWGPAPVGGTDQERYFLLVVDDYTRYTAVFPLECKADVSGVLIPWISATHRQLRERFRRDLPVQRLHSDKGGEFSSSLLEAFCRDKGIRQTFTLPASPQQNGVAERRIGLIMELNLWPRVSEPETSPTLRWTGKVGDALVFRVWGVLSLVRDAKVSKLSSRTLRCVFLGFPIDAPPWQLHHPRELRVFSSHDVTFDEFVCFYRLHLHASHPVPLAPLFLVPIPSRVDPLPPQGPAPSGVSQVDPPPLVEPLEISSDSSGPAEGGDPAADDTAATRRSPRLETPPGFPPRRPSPPPQPAAVDSGAETAGIEPGGAATGGAGSGGAATGGVASGGADSGGAASPSGGGAVGYGPAGTGAASPRGTAGAGGAGGTAGAAAGAGGTRGAAGARGTRAASLGSAGGAARAGGAGATSPEGATGAGAAGAGGAGGATGGTGGAGGAGAAGPGGARTRGAGAARAGGAAGAGGATGVPGAGGAGAGGARVARTAQRRPFFYPLPHSCLPPPDSSQPQLLPGSLLPAPVPHTEVTESLTERREPETRASTPVRARRVARPRPPIVPGTNSMALRPSSVPQRVVLPEPPASSLPHVPDHESNLARAASPTVTRLLASVVTDHDFQFTAAFGLVTELVDFAARSRLDYVASLVTESESVYPSSVGGEPALSSHVLEDRQFELECLAVALPRFASMLLCPEGDPDALDIPTPRSYAEAIAGEYSSQWQTAMDAEMASWKSIGTYVDEVPPPGANIVDGMWIFIVKWPPGSPPAFKARYVARGFSHRQGVDFFHTFSPSPKMTTLRVLLHVAAQRDYELQSLDFSIAFLQGSLYKEIWLRCPPGFTGSFPAGTQWSLRRPVYGLRQVPREWHDTLRTTLTALGFAPSSADLSLFLRTNTTLPPFYVLVSPGTEDGAPSPEIYAGAMAAQEQRWLTYLITDLGERPRSPPVMYVVNKAMLALCHEERLEHRMKHIALRYFLARELQQRRQLFLSYVASRANTADVFTKALRSAFRKLLIDFDRGNQRRTVAASSQVFAAASGSGPESAPCSCRLLSHQTLLWHHRLGHPSLPRLRGMASRVLVSGLPWSLPPLPPGPAPTCVPCVEGRQRAAPHSSEFPPTEAPLQTLHMDVWGPSRVRGQGHERYFLLVVDDYSNYTTVFPLRSKGEVTEVLIDWIRAARLRLRETFGSDFPVLRLHSDRGGEFSSALLGAFCRAQGIRQTFTLPASPQQNGIAERRIGMVMDVAPPGLLARDLPHLAVDGEGWRCVCVSGLGISGFYHPTSRCVLSSQDVTFDESVSYYRLFPYRTAPLPPPPLFLAPGPPPVDPLPPQGPAPSGVSQVDAVEPVEVAADSGAATGAELAGAGSGGAESGGAETGGAEPGGAETWGAEPGGAATGGAEPGGAEPGGTEPGGAEPGGTEPGGTEPGGAGSARVASRGASSRREVLSAQELREWFARRWGRAAGAGGTTAAAGSGGTCPGGAGAAGPGGTAETAGVGPTGGSAGASGGTGAAGSAGTGVAGATGVGAAGGVGAGGSADAGTSEGTGDGAAGAGGATGAGAPAGSPGAVPAGSGGATRPRPYFVPLLEQVLRLPPSPSPDPPLECPQPVQSQSLLRPVSPLPAPSPYTGPTGGLAERRAPASRPACTSRRTSRPRPPASDSLRAASPTIVRFLATVVTDPSLASTAASALVAELVNFAARCCLDYAASLVAESASVCPPSVGGECALSTDVLKDRQEEFQCFAAALPHLVSTLLAPEGDPDAPDIPTPRSYAEAIEGPYSSQWQAAMDVEMASWKSTGTYVDDVPPPGANIVSGMWIFRVKRPPGSPPVFKARYVARGFSQRQGIDYFQTFSPTPKMTTLRVLLHLAAQRDYELHSLDFSTAFLQGSLHEEIWLRRPPGFTGSFPPGTQCVCSFYC